MYRGIKEIVNKEIVIELFNKEIVIEKLFDKILSRSEKVKTTTHLSENQKPKLQHREKQENYLKPFGKPSK